MFENMLPYEPVIRLGAFAAVFFGMAVWELTWPRRPQAVGRLVRWPNNIGIVALNTLVARVVFPTAAVGVGVIAENEGWGLFNVVAVPEWVAFVLAVVLLDFAIYAQHVVFHKVPVLWRLHRMHHADREIDVTTGARFHPIEIVLSMAIKIVVVAALGAAPAAVLIFEVVLNVMATFNHANARLPIGLDRVVRLFVVTPDMHRVHHSVNVHETNSNYGFNLSCWDRLCATYRAQPDAGHDGMTIGLNQFRDPGEQRLDRMLIQPFK